MVYKSMTKNLVERTDVLGTGMAIIIHVSVVFCLCVLYLYIKYAQSLHRIQRTYLVPAIDQYWEKTQAAVISGLNSQKLVLLGKYMNIIMLDMKNVSSSKKVFLDFEWAGLLNTSSLETFEHTVCIITSFEP